MKALMLLGAAFLAGLAVPARVVASAQLASQTTPSAETETYRTLLIRAAPGRLLDLLELYEARQDVLVRAGDARPLIMRHSQGDHWDLMLLFPVGSLEHFHSDERADRVALASAAAGLTEAEFQRRLRDLVSWREELFVLGPDRAALAAASEAAGLFHIEMFIALPGRYDDLLAQRHMENAYLEATQRKANFVFTRVGGAAWDMFTLGFYDDLSAFAAEPDLSPEAFEAAAVEAGFEARNRIGTYLRSLILRHNDTLATRAN